MWYNGAMSRDDLTFPTDEGLLDEMARLLKEEVPREAELARLAYSLSKTFSFREMVHELAKRGAHPPSYSWLARLSTIWRWWVVLHGYDPHEIFQYPRSKLYFMASKKVSDLDFLLARLHLPDSAFWRELKEATNTPQTYVGVRITQEAYQTLLKLVERVKELLGVDVAPGAMAEVAIEMAALLPDDFIKQAWGILHGEPEAESIGVPG